MQTISDAYKNYLESTLSLSPKTKIIIGAKEYLSDVIMTTPKISHSNSSFIGGFPSKTCSLDLYNPNNDIDLIGKEIEVYRGLIINEKIEWVKQGVFIPQAANITNDITSRTYKVSNAQDRTQLLEETYQSNLDWSTSHTGLEIVQEICTRKGFTLETTNFNFANYVFTSKPNFSSAITDREVISKIAQIGGEIAYFNCNGNVVIKSSTPTGHTITRRRYEKLSHEKPITYNTIVLGKEGVEDTIIYPEIIQGERVEYRINDNPFTDLVREEIIETVASFIIGKSIIPFNAQNVVDGFYLELNDSVTIIDKDNNSFEATILNYDTSSRIKSNLKAEITTSISNYNLAGSNRKSINDVKLEVDHNSNQIRGLVTKTDDLTSKTSEIIQDAETYTTTFYDEVIKEQIDALTGAITEEVETRSAGMRVSKDSDNNVVIELGSSTSPFTLELKNDGLYIYQNGELLQYFANSFSNTPNIKTSNLEITPFAFKKRSNGHLSLVKVGDE